MRKALLGIALLGALVVAPTLSAAGGNGAAKEDLLEAAWQNGRAVVVEPEVDVGDVVANTTAEGRLLVTVKVAKGEPTTDYVVRVIGSAMNQTLDGTLSTNRAGKGSLHAGVSIPDAAPDPLVFSIVVRDGDRGQSPHVYRAELSVPQK